MKRETILEVKGVTIKYGRQAAVDAASFSVLKGEAFGIAGESGSGKTSLARAILRLKRPSLGEISYKGKKITERLSKKDSETLTKEIQMIFQDPVSSLNERAKVEYIVGEGLSNFEKLNKAELSERVEAALLDVGLSKSFLGRYPHEFSGGQRQRVGIARALALNPQLIVADEPVSALDVCIRAQIINLLIKLQRERSLTYIFISHDLSVMRFFCDRIACMHKGSIVELADTETFFSHPMHPYTRSLLSAIPYPSPYMEKRKRLIPYDPSVHDYKTSKPILREIEKGHFVSSNEKEASEYRARAAWLN